MTFNEIIEHENFESAIGELCFEDVGYEFIDDDFGPVKLVSQTFGYISNESQDFQIVLDFSGALVGVEGYFSIYGDFEISDIFEVQQMEKNIIVYEKVEPKVDLPRTPDTLQKLLMRYGGYLDYFMAEGSDWETEEGKYLSVDDVIDLGFGKFEFVEEYSKDDYGGSAYSVVLFKDFDLHVKFMGWHSSYEGSKQDTYKFVNPKQKEITVYE